MMKTFRLKQYVVFWGIFLVGVLIPAPLAASGSAQSLSPTMESIDTEKVAEQLWRGFRRRALSSPALREGGNDDKSSGLNCREFQGNSGTLSADAQWCYRCTSGGKHRLLEWSYYAFDFDGPPVCRLEQVHVQEKDLPVPVLEEIHRHLESRLTAEYGAGTRPEGSLGEYRIFGSSAWRNVRRWQTKELLIYLYIFEFQNRPPYIGLLARRMTLRDSIEEGRRLRHIRSAKRGRSGTPLDLELGKELRESFPELTDLLGKWLSLESRRELIDPLRRLLEKAAATPPQGRPALLLAAERLADRIQVAEPPARGVGKVVLRIAGYELNYVWGHLANSWLYRHDLLPGLLEEYGDTEWGEHAFVLKLWRGWDSSLACGEGSDQFRQVIRYGGEFLNERPNSPRRMEVIFHLAQAYETWWSISRASDEDSYVRRTLYQEEANAARKKAIAYFEEVLKLAPGSYEAAYARFRLPRLKLGVDTNQRRFFCIYD